MAETDRPKLLKRRMKRGAAQRAARRPRPLLVCASLTLGAAVAAAPLIYGYQRYEALSAAAMLGLTSGGSQAFLAYGVVGLGCAWRLNRDGRERRKAWRSFGWLCMLGAGILFVTRPGGEVGSVPVLSMTLAIAAGVLLHTSLERER